MTKKKTVEANVVQQPKVNGEVDVRTTKEKLQETISILNDAIDKLHSKKCKILIMCIDSKNHPSGACFDLYVLAYQLYELGYNISVVYQTPDNEEYEGIGDVLEPKYMTLPHIDLKKDKLNVSASDILIIPEIFMGVVKQSMNLPCHRILMCQNFNYLPELLDMGQQLGSMKVLDVITTSETQKNLLIEAFPYLKIQVIEPSINPVFYDAKTSLKTLQVGIVAENLQDANKIAKLFVLKYPQLSFITFKSLNGLKQSIFAEELQKCCCVVWADAETNFGYVPIEALKVRTVPICLVPWQPVDWMTKEDGSLIPNIIWASNLNKIHDLIAATVGAFMNDTIPQEYLDLMGEFDDKFTREIQKGRISEVFDKYREDRAKQLKETIRFFEKELKNEE
jgi:hypothetical protein